MYTFSVFQKNKEKYNPIVFLPLVFLFFGYTANDNDYNNHAKLIFSELLAKLHIGDKAVQLEFVNGLAYGAVCDSVDAHAVIKIDPIRFSQYSDIVLIAALSHELGHFYYRHKVSKPNIEQEKEADRFCGQTMRMLGFQRVEEIYECLLFTPENGNSFYPPKSEREHQMNMGWAAGQPSVIDSYQSFNPLVFWRMRNDSLLVKIDNKQVGSDNLDLFGYMLYYDKETFSTYQLLDFDFKDEHEGTGRLVSNKTPYCYKRATDRLGRKKLFSIYKYGRDYLKLDCTPPDAGIYINKEGDVELKCYDRDQKMNVIFILKYYQQAPEDYILPAYIK